MTKQLTDKQIELTTLAILIFGYSVTYKAVGDYHPTMYIQGKIVGVQTHSETEVEIIVKTDKDDRTFRVCKITLNTLIDTKAYVSDNQWSRTSTFIYLN
jgi:hypothetical protein